VGVVPFCLGIEMDCGRSLKMLCVIKIEILKKKKIWKLDIMR
jgi:hypothetical protein